MSDVAQRTRGGWSALRVVGLLLAALSVVAGTLCAVKIVATLGRPLAEMLTAPAQQAPFDEFLSLGAGRYAVYERVGPAVGSDGSGVSAPTTLTPQQVTVVGPAGAVEVTTPSFEEGLDLSDGHFVAVASFTTPSEGQYRVRVRSREPATVVVAPRLGSGLGEAGAWLLGAGLSGLGLLVGAGMFLASFLRRSGPRPAAAPPPPPAAPPAGWYPDPQVPGQLRYWDGTAWTAHTQPA